MCTPSWLLDTNTVHCVCAHWVGIVESVVCFQFRTRYSLIHGKYVRHECHFNWTVCLLQPQQFKWHFSCSATIRLHVVCVVCAYLFLLVMCECMCGMNVVWLVVNLGFTQSLPKDEHLLPTVGYLYWCNTQLFLILWHLVRIHGNSCPWFGVIAGLRQSASLTVFGSDCEHHHSRCPAWCSVRHYSTVKDRW